MGLLARWRRECRHPRWVFPSPYFPENPVSNASCTKRVRDIADGAGLADVTAHTARHTYATRMIEQGVDVPTVSEALGHRTLSSTTVYTRSRPTRVAQAVAGLDFRTAARGTSS